MSTAVVQDHVQKRPNRLVSDLKFPVRFKTLREKTPAEVGEAVERHCRRYKLGRRDRAEIEEQFVLQYFFGGATIPVVYSREGLLVLASDLPDNPSIIQNLIVDRQLKGQRVLFLNPSPWEGDYTEILSPVCSDE